MKEALKSEFNFLQYFEEDEYKLAALIAFLIVAAVTYLIRLRMKLAADDRKHQRNIELEKSKFNTILNKKENEIKGKELDFDV